MTREEALQKVNAFFDAHQGAPTVDANWNVKIEVFEGVKVEIKELKLVAVSIESKQGLGALKLSSPVNPVEEKKEIQDVEMKEESDIKPTIVTEPVKVPVTSIAKPAASAKKVRSPFAPRLDAFLPASVVLSYLDYKGPIERLLKGISSNSRQYVFIHGPMIRNILVGSPILNRLQKKRIGRGNFKTGEEISFSIPS